MINEFLKEYIKLKAEYEAGEGNGASVLALYLFADRLGENEAADGKKVLVDVYLLLGRMKSACDLLESIVDESDRKQRKKLVQLQLLRESHGDSYSLPRPLGEAEKEMQRERLSRLPPFRYHPDPLGTGAFEQGEERTCPCCGEKSTVYYSQTPYCIEEVEDLCPGCIASGKAAEKYDAGFVQDAAWVGETDQEKDDVLFHRTPGYISWQGEYWLSCCGDYCAYLGTVGTAELKAMDIAQEVFADYIARGGYEKVEKDLVKDGFLCGYLFRCLHCGKHHLWVDAD